MSEKTKNENMYSGVGYRLPEFEEMLPEWLLIDDVIKGERVVKDKAETYLPPPVPFSLDDSEENKARYAAYLERAVFYAVTKRTINGLVGQVFRADPVLEGGNEELETMKADIDGSGVTLNQQSQKTLFHVLGKGRAGLYVDFPITEGSNTRQAQLEEGIRPVVIQYAAHQIINWKTKAVGSENRLSLVVVVSDEVIDTDDFEPEIEARWRALRLDENNEYYVEIYRFDEDKGQFELVKEPNYPTDGNGNRFNYIPFTFVGSTNNDPMVDNPPLNDIATLNIAHYRNSADYEEIVFITGQPTPYAAGLTEHWAKEIMGDNIQLGSRALLLLPEGGSAGLIQAESNQLASEAMKHKEEQMVKLGAKLIESVTVQRTAKDATMQEASETSVLSQASENVSAAYTTCLGFVYDFLGQEFDPDNVYFELNKDFEVHNMTPQDQQALIASWMAGAILDEEMREQFRRSGIATVDLEEWRTKSEEELMNKQTPPGGDPNEDEDPDEDPDGDPE